MVPWGEHTIDLTPPWTRLTVKDAVAQYTGLARADVDDVADAPHATPPRTGFRFPTTRPTARS